MHLPVSVVTIVKSRTEKLCHLIEQLEHCHPSPAELVIVWMSSPSELSLIRSEKFDIVHKFVNQDDLPIARARNKGLLEAKHDTLVYMNVDAICAPNFIEAGLREWSQHSVLHTKVKMIDAECWHLDHNLISASMSSESTLTDSDANDTPKKDTPSEDGPSEDNNEIPHRDQITIKQEDHHGKFSHDSICSTVFFINKTDFEKTGGFDEGYSGFGINDEDFFTNCRTLGFAIKEIPQITFLPERPNYQCPVNHLLDFVKNAERYYSKWGKYPRPDVLDAYAEAGYINQDYIENGIQVLQLPNASKNEDDTETPMQTSPELSAASITPSRMAAQVDKQVTQLRNLNTGVEQDTHDAAANNAIVASRVYTA